MHYSKQPNNLTQLPFDVLCDQVRVYAKRFQELLLQKNQCIDKMEPLAQELKEYEILRSLPAIGANTAVRTFVGLTTTDS